MLGVFLLPAFTRLGHERQDLLSPCHRMHVCTDWTSIYTLIRKRFWGLESEPMLTPKGKIPSTGKILPSGGSNPRRCIKQDSEPNTLLTSYSAPPPSLPFISTSFHSHIDIHQTVHLLPLSHRHSPHCPPPSTLTSTFTTLSASFHSHIDIHHTVHLLPLSHRHSPHCLPPSTLTSTFTTLSTSFHSHIDIHQTVYLLPLSH